MILTLRSIWIIKSSLVFLEKLRKVSLLMKKIDPLLNYIKSTPDLLKTDPGFMKFLEGMPDDFRNAIINALNNGDILCQSLEMLPENMQMQIADIFSSRHSVPEEALSLYKQCRYFEARALLLKTIDIYKDSPQTTHSQFDQSIAFVFQRVQSLTYNLLGDVEKALGNIIDAGDYYLKAVELAQSLGDVDTIVNALHGIGLHLWERGDLEGSKKYFHDALNVIAGQKDSWQSQSRILTALSCVYDAIGQFDEAQRYGLEAINVCREKEDYVTLPNCLNNLACLNLEWQTLDKALALLEEGLDVAREHDQQKAEALILSNIAMTYLQLASIEEDMEQAENYLESAQGFFEDALEKSRMFGNIKLEAMNIGNTGYLHQMKGEYQDATEAFSKAAVMFHNIGARADEARYLSALANHLNVCVNDQERALQAGKEAIRLFEGIRGGLKKENHRISFAASVTDPYETTIMCLMTLQRADEALEYMERAKSRALLELFSARIMQSGFIKTDSETFHQAIKMLVEMDEIRRNLDDSATVVMSSQEGEADDPDLRAREDNGQYLNQSLRDLMEEKERHFARIVSDVQADLPDTAGLWSVSSTSADQIREVLDEETFLLELFQAGEQLYMVCLSQNKVPQVFNLDLSGQEAMDIIVSISEAIQSPSLRDISSHDYIRYIQKPLSRMYDLMIVPLKEWIETYKRCLIIPHLGWHYFPFHSLFDSKNKVFLCDQIEVGFCSSGGILRQCKQKNRIARKNALLMSRHDGDLPYADEEVRLLSQSFLNGNGHVYTGDNAWLDRATDKAAYDIIHLACHGWFNSEQPFLSGVAIPPSKGEKRNTFLLDFFNMQMPCTQITLSACESGLSNFTAADELIGLSRGLFGAGATSLLLSLWKVADESTVYLMQNYYRHFVANQQSKTRALQLAMQDVKARTEYAHPYYWAPFVLMGDWR